VIYAICLARHASARIVDQHTLRSPVMVAESDRVSAIFALDVSAGVRLRLSG
jgi:hypothetical protein